MHNFNRANTAGFRVLRKNIEDACITNNIWKIREGFSECQTQRHNPVIHGRSGLTYTPLDKAIEVYEGHFRSNPEAKTFDNFYRQIR
jgi:hypothetical protein